MTGNFSPIHRKGFLGGLTEGRLLEVMERRAPSH